jgi:predicted ATPase/DNA-binding CsgD family transcriptional regulator
MVLNAVSTHPNPFIGRKAELMDICTRLENPECRLLTITGLGGSGKTRLALEVAQTVSGQFQHGVVFVALQPVARSELLISTLAQAIGFTFYGDEAPDTQLFNFLHEKSYLLVLDNFEHLLDGAVLLSRLLAYAPKVKLLVTSREALNLREEWLYPLKGMITPPSIYATALEHYDAAQLFLHHAYRIQPDFDAIAEHEAVFRICTLTEGLPLALELAASWLKGLGARQIALEMQHNLDFLSTTMRNIEERHRSMRAVFNHSWSLLTDEERQIFAKLSVFRGGFRREAAEQVTQASLFQLLALAEKSLVYVESEGRFSIHELLRQYGMEKLEAFGETEATYHLHSQHYAERLTSYEAELKGPNQLDYLQSMERDFENVRLAWEWAAKSQQGELLNGMLNSLYLFGFLRSRYRETIALFQYALAQSLADTSLVGRLLSRRWGYLHWWYQSDYQDALEGIQQAMQIALGQNPSFEFALNHVMQDAGAGIQEAMKIALDRNDVFEVAFTELMTAYVMISMRRYEDAITHLETSQALFTALDEPYYICWVMHRLGYAHFNLNNAELSMYYTAQSLELARISHNRVAMVIGLYNLGSEYILRGEYAKGRQHCLEALQIATEAGHQGQIAHALSLVALCAFCQGDYEISQEYAERSHAMIEDINMFIFQPYNSGLLILLACLREDYAYALQLSERSKQHITNPMGYQLMSWASAVLAWSMNYNREEARAYLREMLQRSDIDTHLAIYIWMLPSAAFVLSETEREKAIELLAWMFVSSDPVLIAMRQWPLVERLQQTLQETNDAEIFQALWANGQNLSFDAIRLEVLHQFGEPTQTRSETPPQDQLLTTREREILHMMAEGLTNPQIADRLFIGAGTVKTHTLSIYRKLDVANRTQAIVRAQELGLLPV